MVEGAITFQAVPCEEVMTKIGKVTFTISMETVLDNKVLNSIRENGFSRIPICKEGNRNQIIAFLLTKSLVGIDTHNKTVQQLYIEKRIQVRIPLYIHREATLGRMIKQFQTGRSHMAIVLQTAAAAQELCDIADAYNQKVTKKMSVQQHDSADFLKVPDGNEKDESSDESVVDGEKEIVGIVTLENVIERILMTDIHDEKDRD